MHIVHAGFGDRARWNGYVERHADASVYHRWEFGELFEDVYGARSFPLLAEREGRVVGVLPLTRLSSPMFGTSLVSVPYFGHGGALAEDPDAWRALVAEAGVLAAELSAKHVELRHAHPVPAEGMPTRDDKVLMHLALPADPDGLLKAVGAKARADIRRPEKEGMTAQVGGRELVPDFHRAYASVMRDLGSPCHGVALFDELARRLEDRVYVVTVRYQGRPVGGGILVGMNGTLEIPCAGSLHAFTRLRGNMMLYWNVLKEAIARGYKTFSFGRSSADSGTYTFKKNWGARPVPLPYHYVLAPGRELPSVNPHNPKFARVIQAWQRLPVPLTTVLGPRLVRYFA
ncbi:MAG: FemAB family PEP-CTERM system-associated protein [Deltaproteobacteria bacterium]|nr:FemAB family PEP-CTERM system-associated protein [Deltaproteobacteria bacterium]